MKYKDPLEHCARQYLQGKLEIHRIVSFCKSSTECQDSYRTTEAAFMFPVSGTCEVTFDEVCFEAQYGTVIHGCPNRQIRFRVTGPEPFCYINLYYITSEELLFDFQPAGYEIILTQLKQWLAYQASEDKFAPMIRSIKKQVFSRIFHPYLLSDVRSEIDLVNEVEAYLQEHYMMDLSLDFISEIFGKTKNQMSYLFYKYKNIRPIDYLISYRLSVAGHLLTTTNLTITEIARSVGYRDSLFFSRLFKRHYGCPPSRFRAMYQ